MRAICCAILAFTCEYMATKITDKTYRTLKGFYISLSWLLIIASITLMILGL